MSRSEEEDRRDQTAALRRHRLLAGGLLVIAAAAFVLLHLYGGPGFWPSLARAGAEAALVGGLADWFAVAALFRRPLGLPIPHTAVIPANRERIARGLAGFVERHFLDPALIAARLADSGVSGRVARWLSRRDNADRVAAGILGALPDALGVVGDRQARRFFRQALERQAATLDIAPFLGAGLARLRRSDRHHAFLDFVIASARRFLLRNEARVYEIVSDRSNWWVPRTVDRRIANAIVVGLADLLGDLSQPGHEVRLRFDAAVDDLIDKLKHDRHTRARVQALKAQVMRGEEMESYLNRLWDDVARQLRDGAADPDSALRGALVDTLTALGRGLERDEAMRRRLDGALAEAARGLVLPWRREIGRFIADVVRGWETKTVVERFELAVGRDLQYIRMNGTLVGALVGCGLFLVTRWLG
jgi:uncharacterized membrane-anchored protein YjiN (DUF445 family)